MECVQRAIEIQSTCPTCRSECSVDQLVDLPRGTLGFRIWSDIQVKCNNCEDGCSWTGSIVDFTAHSDRCNNDNHTTTYLCVEDLVVTRNTQQARCLEIELRVWKRMHQASEEMLRGIKRDYQGAQKKMWMKISELRAWKITHQASLKMFSGLERDNQLSQRKTVKRKDEEICKLQSELLCRENTLRKYQKIVKRKDEIYQLQRVIHYQKTQAEETVV